MPSTSGRARTCARPPTTGLLLGDRHGGSRPGKYRPVPGAETRDAEGGAHQHSYHCPVQIRFGATHPVDRRGAARVRGAVAGLISGGVAVAAHGWAAPTTIPDSTAIMLLGATAAVLGALVAGFRTGQAGLTAALAAGQLVGHFCLGWGSGHLHHGDLQLTPAMIAAHVLAAWAAALLVRGTEAAYRAGAAALSRIIPLVPRPPAIAGPAPLRATHRDRLVPRILVTGTGGTRGPPTAVLV